MCYVNKILIFFKLSIWIDAIIVQTDLLIDIDYNITNFTIKDKRKDERKPTINEKYKFTQLMRIKLKT